jgi:hypothetical protein
MKLLEFIAYEVTDDAAPEPEPDIVLHAAMFRGVEFVKPSTLVVSVLCVHTSAFSFNLMGPGLLPSYHCHVTLSCPAVLCAGGAPLSTTSASQFLCCAPTRWT